MLTRGFPEEILLFFTLLIWGLYSLVYISSPRNKVNQWAGICGFLLSIGVLKEYLYYSVFFSGTAVMLFGVEYELNELLNSILTAVLYYMAMPCVMIFSFYFCHLEKRHPRIFRVLSFLVFVPVVLFGIVYPWSQTREIPKTNPSAFVVVALYNLLYGGLATGFIMAALVEERDGAFFRQRRLVSVIALLPLWYWLITLFLFHLLNLEKLFKLWQGNAVILSVLFVYYVRHLFREGIWGLRLSREYFDWSGNEPEDKTGTKYMAHMMKNELAKITACTRLLRERPQMEGAEELEILERSVRHMETFFQRSKKYSEKIKLRVGRTDIGKMLENVAGEKCIKWSGELELQIPDDFPILMCDEVHMKEAVGNLISNALDAMGPDGKLTLSCSMPRRNIALISVRDTGPGIQEKCLNRIFEPYYTRYSDSRHMGLGLAYCQNVIKAHKGYIRVISRTGEEDHGTTVILCIPQEKGRKKSEKSDQSPDRGG